VCYMWRIDCNRGVLKSMPRSRFSDAERTAAEARLATGESVAQVAKAFGRSRQSLARIKAAMDRRSMGRLDVTLTVRLALEERAALQTAAEEHGLTVSEAIRHLARQASGLLALRSDEQEALATARRELSSVGTNLNQLARLGAGGRLKWNPGDSALLRKVLGRVDDLAEQVVGLVAFASRPTGLGSVNDAQSSASAMSRQGEVP
jgi:transposase-like protein